MQQTLMAGTKRMLRQIESGMVDAKLGHLCRAPSTRSLRGFEHALLGIGRSSPGNFTIDLANVSLIGPTGGTDTP